MEYLNQRPEAARCLHRCQFKVFRGVNPCIVADRTKVWEERSASVWNIMSGHAHNGTDRPTMGQMGPNETMGWVTQDDLKEWGKDTVMAESSQYPGRTE
jgi:hypothetical protein